MPKERQASRRNSPKSVMPGSRKDREIVKLVEKSRVNMVRDVLEGDVSAQAAEVMMSIVSPGLPSNVRFASPYTTGLTSLAQLKQPISVRFGADAGYLDTQYSSCGFVFRDPVRNAILYDGNPGGDLIEYQIRFLRGTDESADTSYYGAPGPMKMAFAEPTGLSAFDAHGDKLGVGLGNGNATYIWSQANYTWVITEGGAVTRRYHVFKWTPKSEVFLGQYNATGGSNPISNLAVTGYIRFEVFQCDASVSLIMNELPLAQAVAIKFQCTGGVFRHLSIPEYDSKSLSAEKVRTLAQGFLFTNTTPAIARGGKIATKQLPGDEPWYEYALNGYNAIALLSNTDLRDATNGEYAYLKPTTVSDLEMVDNVDTNGGSIVMYGFDLDSARSYLGYYAVLPTDASQSAQFTALTNIEFESSDQWYTQASSSIDPKVFDEAIHQIAHIQQYDENPLHLKDLMATVKRYAKKIGEGLVKYGPTAIEVGSAVASML